ncbi:MAG TPA: hypothetical protein GX509_02955 [Firmicutes bacterium]|nr:hypothetical protein [Bacillota bacterium]
MFRSFAMTDAFRNTGFAEAFKKLADVEENIRPFFAGFTTRSWNQRSPNIWRITASLYAASAYR